MCDCVHKLNQIGEKYLFYIDVLFDIVSLLMILFCHLSYLLSYITTMNSVYHAFILCLVEHVEGIYQIYIANNNGSFLHQIYPGIG